MRGIAIYAVVIAVVVSVALMLPRQQSTGLGHSDAPPWKQWLDDYAKPLH